MSLRARTGDIGFVLLCVWLIAVGLVPLLGIASNTITIILNLIATSAGALLLIDR